MRTERLLVLLLAGFCVGCISQESTETASREGTGMSPVAGAAGIDLGTAAGTPARPAQSAVPPPGSGTGYPPGDTPPVQPSMQPPAQPMTRPPGPSSGQLPIHLPPALRPVGPGSPSTGAPAVPGAGTAAPSGDAVRAGVGVAKRGRSLDNMSGVIVTPAKTLFAFQERAVFEIQLPQALKLFEATNGRKPKSHEEYMASIIKANNIRLPELPQGQRYHFDVQRGELMVYKPRQ
ncbi:MAG: hypothetical protein ACC628_02605 [Pirellulaceae bacterium]